MRKQAKKTAVTVVGFIVLIAGIIMIPYPGPGWLVVFAALGILSTEYVWAKRMLQFARGKYDAWQSWLARQNRAVKMLFWVLTALVVIVTIWLLNGYGLLNHLLHLGWDWADSPLSIFHR